MGSSSCESSSLDGSHYDGGEYMRERLRGGVSALFQFRRCFDALYYGKKHIMVVVCAAVVLLVPVTYM